ncbi:sensor histidine kinase [Flaviaesturariibacter amylovorans]|uniref:Histidine kinase n=1 Tax=Flaviaesturariibacter amylovorans TaxID=1084520 RepID=A0ABP8GH85_9BACT
MEKQLNDIRFRLLGAPLVAMMGHLIFYNRNDAGDGDPFGFWGIYAFSLLETVLLWETARLVIGYFRRRYPHLRQTAKRIVLSLLASTAVAVVIRIANIWVYDQTLLWGYKFPLEGYLQAVFVALLFIVVIGGIYEGAYYLRMWHSTALEAERLKKEHLQTQLDSLKVQINPHFLFNSLGSLASLIPEDPDRAVEFVEELSRVYRYLLQANEKTVTTVADELHFIASYYRLQKIRFGDGIELVQQVTDEARGAGIPPLTLQLLVENAIKHNAILPARPLLITITSTNDLSLVVRNNLQPRTSAAASERLGLRNISEKYRLLEQPAVVVEQTADAFQVTLPLIHPLPA